MKVYAYLRVSTDQQAESGAGLAAQRDSCLKWAESQGIVIEHFYSDEGISGSTGLDKRPALLEAISQLQRDDILVVAKRDRLGRDLILVAMMEAAIVRKHAKIASVAGEGTDCDDPSSIMMRHIVDVFSEYEKNVIKARTKSAMQAKKKSNERVGHIPFGFRLANDGVHLEEDEGEQLVLGQIHNLIKNNLSTRKIAAEMNRRQAFNRGNKKWNHGSIHRVMQKIAA